MTMILDTTSTRSAAVFRYLPFGDLERVLAVRHGPDDVLVQQPNNPLFAGMRVSNEFIAGHCWVDRGTVARWRHAGRIELHKAERAAERAGYHPIEIWGDTYLSIITTEEPACA